ncbi:MAG: hypothetical protein OXQ31_09765 [Spirochaetaceae bacterium]|nr:hypothetical protein [Spirochaetaceae bacterium]
MKRRWKVGTVLGFAAVGAVVGAVLGSSIGIAARGDAYAGTIPLAGAGALICGLMASIVVGHRRWKTDR